MMKAIRTMEGGDAAQLDIVFVLIGYRDPDQLNPMPPLVNDVLAPLFGLYAGMSGHETHLAREMKLADQPKAVQTDPYESRPDGEPGYEAIVLCKEEVKSGGERDYDPPMDWVLSAEAKRYIENSLIPGKAACAADANADAVTAIVRRLGG